MDIDADALKDLTVDLINIPSPPGSEEAAALYLEQYFRRLGLRTWTQEVEPGRREMRAKTNHTHEHKRPTLSQGVRWSGALTRAGSSSRTRKAPSVTSTVWAAAHHRATNAPARRTSRK